MTLARSCLQLLLVVGLAGPTGCGGSSLNDGRSGGGAGEGAMGGTAADGGSSGTAGSSSGSSGATGGGGSSQGGSSVGGVSGVGGGVGGTGGSGGMGGSSGGMGGTAAGTGGTVAGSAGCGFCPFVACAPAITLEVTAPADIADLVGEVTNVTSSVTLGPLQCYPNGGTGACSWFCSFFQIGLGGDYSIELSAPGYQTKIVEFSVDLPTSCGCCGCGCGSGYSGTAELVSSAAAPPECCALRDSDPTNCGTCGNVCASGEACVSGDCGAI